MKTAYSDHPYRLTGKTVVITGASRGIGAEVARACAEAGAARVGLLGRDRDALQDLANEVSGRGADPVVMVCDVTSVRALREAFDGLAEIDVLVSSAGINQPEWFDQVAVETFDALFSVNVRAAFFAAQAAAGHMRRVGRGGVIVTIGSQMGHVGATKRSVYCATKHAVEGFSKALAIELAPDNIRVLTVAPTFVTTEMTRGQLDDPTLRRQLLDQIPLHQFASPRDVADGVVYAACDAAKFLTGTSLVLDGGWTAR